MSKKTTNILVTVLGLSPAVVTETLWRLLHRADDQAQPDPFVVDEIWVITTAKGADGVRKSLDGEDGAVARFCKAYDIPRPTRIDVQPIRDARGKPLEDIRTEADNIAVGDTAVRVVGELCAGPETRVHASMAGGRKTMSFFMGYVMSLFGRTEDELSHILVNARDGAVTLNTGRPVTGDDFERCRDFWYPMPADRFPDLLHRKVSYRNNATDELIELDAADAVLDLMPVPFVRLGDYFSDKERATFRNMSFRDVVDAIQMALRPLELELHDEGHWIKAGGRRVVLLPTQYALYKLLATVLQEGRPGAGPHGLGQEHQGWLSSHDLLKPQQTQVIRLNAFYAEALKTHGTRGDKGDPANNPTPPERESLENRRTKINDTIKAALPNPTVNKHFRIHTVGRNPVRFGLKIDPAKIRFFHDEPLEDGST